MTIEGIQQNVDTYVEKRTGAKFDADGNVVTPNTVKGGLMLGASVATAATLFVSLI